MVEIPTSIVTKRHAWTSDDVPWSIDAADDAAGDGDAADRRLLRYLAGGSLGIYANSTARQMVSRRQTRFLWFAAALGAAWLLFRFV